MTAVANTGRFRKGMTPWNKGKPMRSSTWEKVRRTTFQRGNIPHTAVPVGTHRRNKEGVVEWKVRDASKTGYPYRWVAKHRWLYEKLHGPVPPGFVLKCLSDDRTLIAPGNWACVSRGVNARLRVMGFESAGTELKATLLARALLEDRIGQIRPSSGQRHQQRLRERRAA